MSEGRIPPRFSGTLLSAYESGQKRPGPEYLNYLCCVYQAEPANLGYPGQCLCGRTHRAAALATALPVAVPGAGPGQPPGAAAPRARPAGVPSQHRPGLVLRAAYSLGETVAAKHGDFPALRDYREALVTS